MPSHTPIEPPPFLNSFASLPRKLRDKLGQRLNQGDSPQAILDWFNQPSNSWALEDRPPGTPPFTEQDLADWKQEHYPKWLEDQQAYEFVRHLAEHAGALDAASDYQPVSDSLASVLATELARSASVLLAQTTDPAGRWSQLRELLQALACIRKGDHQSLRVQTERERWEREQMRLDTELNERDLERLKANATAPIWAARKKRCLADLWGGGKDAEDLAGFITAVEFDLPIPEWAKRADPAKSDQIRPLNPT